jgi:hypothetical protein
MDMLTVKQIRRKMWKRNLQIRLAFAELGRIMTNFREDGICKTSDMENNTLFKYKTTLNFSYKPLWEDGRLEFN